MVHGGVVCVVLRCLVLLGAVEWCLMVLGGAWWCLVVLGGAVCRFLRLGAAWRGLVLLGCDGWCLVVLTGAGKGRRARNPIRSDRSDPIGSIDRMDRTDGRMKMDG